MNPSFSVPAPVEPAPGSAVDPRVEEISWAAWRVTGAAGLDHAALAALLHQRTRLLAQTLWQPGRVALVSQVRRAGDTVLAEIAIGCLGAKGETGAELQAARSVVRSLLAEAADVPVSLAEVDPTEVLHAPLANVVDHGVIRQRTVSVDLGIGDSQVDVLSRYNLMPNPWLVLMRELAIFKCDIAVRATAMPTSLGIVDRIELSRAAALLDNAMSAQPFVPSGPVDAADVVGINRPSLRVTRARRTVHDLIESYETLSYVGEIAFVSSEPLAAITQRSIAGAFTSETDVIHHGELTSVAAHSMLLGGFDVEVRPEGLLDALAKGLPLHGGTTGRELRDLVTLTELPFGLPSPDGAGLPATSNHLVHSRPVPEGLREGTLIGHTPGGEPVHLPLNAARRHGIYLGTTGSGKSTRLVSAALTDLREGRAIVFIDPHGTAVDRLRGHLAAEDLAMKVHVIGLSCGQTTGWRPFEAFPDDPADRAAYDRAIATIGEFVGAVRTSVHKDWTGPRFDQLARAIVSLAAAHGVHLGTAIDWFIDLRALQAKVRHPAIAPAVRLALLRAHSSGADGVAVLDWVVSKFSGITEGPLGRMLATPRRGLTGQQLLTEGASLLIDLSGLPAQDAALFGHLVLAGVLEAAMSTHTSAGVNIYVDEAQRFPVSGLTRILTEGRKFSASVHLASQSLATLEPELADAACGAATVFAFRQSPDSAQRLGQMLGVPASELLNLPDLTAAVKVSDHPTTTVIIDPYEDVPDRVILDLSALEAHLREPEWLCENDDLLDEGGDDPDTGLDIDPHAADWSASHVVVSGGHVVGRDAESTAPGTKLLSAWRQFAVANPPKHHEEDEDE